jgi:GntR family transcriptional regulator/MocR family aminotransferase
MAKRSRGDPIAMLDGREAGAGLRERIYRTLHRAIAEGRLAPGQRLPSARDLAGDWHVSRNTVDDALAQLQAEGLLERSVGAGTFVTRELHTQGPLRAPSSAAREVLELLSEWSVSAIETHADARDPRPRPFNAAMPALDHFPHDAWNRLARARLREGNDALLRYHGPMGYEPLQHAVCRYLAASRGVRCAPSQVMILNSAMQGLDLVSRILLERDDAVWLEDPSYPNARVTLGASGARMVPVRVDEEGLDVEAGRRAEAGAALAYVSPACQFPTGARMSLARRRALLDWADASGAWIVEDDFQAEFARAGGELETLYALDGGRRVFLVGSFAHSVFPSLRLAYMVLPETCGDAFCAVRAQLDGHTHVFMQAVLADFMQAGAFGAHVRAMARLYARRRAILAESLRGVETGVAAVAAASGGMSTALWLHDAREEQVEARLAASGAQLELVRISRYHFGPARRQGFVLGYSALDEAQIAQAGGQLAGILLDL